MTYAEFEAAQKGFFVGLAVAFGLCALAIWWFF